MILQKNFLKNLVIKMALTNSQKETKEKILNYINLETRGGCFYLIGEHLSGKTYLLQNISKELFGDNKILNFNLSVSEFVINSENYNILAKVNSPKLKDLVREYIENLLNNPENYEKIKIDNKEKNILMIDNLEILYEYNVDFISLFDKLSYKRKGFEKKIVVSIPGLVSGDIIYAFSKIKYSIPNFSKGFWSELNKKEL